MVYKKPGFGTRIPDSRYRDRPSQHNAGHDRANNPLLQASFARELLKIESKYFELVHLVPTAYYQ